MADKNKNRTLSNKLKKYLGATIFLSAGITLLFIGSYKGLNQISFFILLSIFFTGFIISQFLVFFNIYKPLKTVETAADILIKGDDNLSDTQPLNFQELVELLKESVDREYTADMLKNEAELKALQSQINPHFLYNVLDGIRGHAMAEGVEELAEMAEALSQIFRYSVSHWENEVTLESELTNVKSYFKIQQYRFNSRFELKIDIDDEENALACRLPKLTLQPIIENAIYHGLETKLSKGLVSIKTQLTENLLLIEIQDDGVGANQQLLEKINNSFRDWKTIKTEKNRTAGMGIALTNVNSRIKMMYGEEYGLHMYSTEEAGSMIEILLPRQA